MLKGFKEFLSRGNVVDLATAVVIGAAFTGLVTSFTEKVIQPLVTGSVQAATGSTGFSRSHWAVIPSSSWTSMRFCQPSSTS
jgi:large conductance mechanosensitive channel protein